MNDSVERSGNMDTSIEKLVSSFELGREGKFISFDAMMMIFDEAQTLTGQENAPSQLLKHLALRHSMKPSFTTDGYSIVPVYGPNIEAPPASFSFDNGEWPKPSRSTNTEFYPLIKKGDLHHYLAHSIRWFKHPLRPGMMFPLRLDTYFLGVEHPVSRMYVDMPVVFRGKPRLSYLRISLTVFELILGSQTGQNGKWCRLSKAHKPTYTTEVESLDVPEGDEHHMLWNLFPEHDENFQRLRHFAEKKDRNRYAARLVADHLLKM